MLTFPASYLVYNFLLGIVFSFMYFSAKGYEFDAAEFCELLFFPATGYGKWVYNRKVKLGEAVELPRRWYLYKNMVKINWGFIVLFLVFGAMLFMGVGKYFGSGMEWGSHQDNPVAWGFGLLLDLGALLVSVLVFFIVATILLVFFVLMIVLPSRAAKNIELNHYRGRYEAPDSPETLDGGAIYNNRQVHDPSNPASWYYDVASPYQRKTQPPPQTPRLYNEQQYKEQTKYGKNDEPKSPDNNLPSPYSNH